MVSLNRKDRLNKKIRSAAKMVIYTEGDVTEPQYLADWIKKIAVKNSINPIKANMKFNIVPSKDESEPLKVVNNLIENEKPIKNNLDIFYAVFDEDDRSLGGKIKRILIRLLRKLKITMLKLFALIGLLSYGL